MVEIDKRADEYLDERYPKMKPENRKKVALHFKAGYKAGFLAAKQKLKKEENENSAHLPIKRFLDDRVIRAYDGKGILLKAFGVAYRAWCDEQKFAKAKSDVSSKWLASTLRKLGYVVKRSPLGTSIKNVRLSDDGWKTRFVASCLSVAEPEDKATVQEIYERYLRWAEAKRIHIPAGQTDIVMLVRGERFPFTTSNSGAIFSGVKLVYPTEPTPAKKEAKRNDTLRTGRRFIEKRLAIGTGKISAKELYAIFVAWVGDGRPDKSYVVFGKVLKSCGFHSRHTVKGNVWDNVQILDEPLTSVTV